MSNECLVLSDNTYQNVNHYLNILKINFTSSGNKNIGPWAKLIIGSLDQSEDEFVELVKKKLYTSIKTKVKKNNNEYTSRMLNTSIIPDVYSEKDLDSFIKGDMYGFSFVTRSGSIEELDSAIVRIYNQVMSYKDINYDKFIDKIFNNNFNDKSLDKLYIHQKIKELHHNFQGSGYYKSEIDKLNYSILGLEYFNTSEKINEANEAELKLEEDFKILQAIGKRSHKYLYDLLEEISENFYDSTNKSKVQTKTINEKILEYYKNRPS